MSEYFELYTYGELLVMIRRWWLLMITITTTFYLFVLARWWQIREYLSRSLWLAMWCRTCVSSHQIHFRCTVCKSFLFYFVLFIMLHFIVRLIQNEHVACWICMYHLLPLSHIALILIISHRTLLSEVFAQQRTIQLLCTIRMNRSWIRSSIFNPYANLILNNKDKIT